MEGIRLLLLLSLVVMAGCPNSERPPHTPTPPEADTSASTGNGESDAPRNAHSGASTNNDGTTSRSDGSQTNTSGQTNHPLDAQSRRLLADLGSGDPITIKAASDELASLHSDGGANIFQQHLGDADPRVRRGALWGTLFSGVAGFNPQEEKMVAAVNRGLRDEVAGVRHVALEAVNTLARGDQWFVASIEDFANFVDLAHEPDADNRILAARMLGKHRTLSQPALGVLNEAVKNDPHEDVRAACLYAIYNIARNAEEALPAPTYVLRHDDSPRLRRLAARRLGSYKSASAPAIPELIAALSDNAVPHREASDPQAPPEEPVSVAASDALSRIGKPAVQPLVMVLASENRFVRMLAARALGQMGPTAKEATAALKRLAASDDTQEANVAKAALLEINAP